MIKLLHRLFGCTHFPVRVPELVPDDLVLDKRNDKRNDKVAWVANPELSGGAAVRLE